MRDPETAEYQDYPLSSRVRSDGTFAFFGVPDLAFPHLAEHAYQLHIDVSGSHYLPLTHQIELGPTVDQPQTVSRSIPIEGLEPMRPRLFTHDLPRTGIVLRLDRRAVRLKGRVLDASAPETGVGGAELKVSADLSAITDQEGFFEFSSPMPLELAIVISVSALGFIEERLEFELDYNQPVNEFIFSLRQS
jgi:hypothetical protein